MDFSNRYNFVFGRALPPTAMTMPLPALQLGTALPGVSARSALTPQPDESEASRARERVMPQGQPDPGEPERFDKRRIGQNAMVSAISQGGCFGLAFALNNYLRLKAPPMIKRLSAIMSPLLAGFLTSPAEKLTRDKVGMQPTRASSLTLLHDAIPSVVLYAVNAAYVHARKLPKFAPNTRAGAATTLLLSIGSTGLAGALSEAAAQASGGKPMAPLTRPEVVSRGLRRALCLTPMSRANLTSANHVIREGRVPPELALAPLKAGTFGWIFRNRPKPPSTPSPSPSPVLAGGPSQPSPSSGVSSSTSPLTPLTQPPGPAASSGPLRVSPPPDASPFAWDRVPSP